MDRITRRWTKQRNKDLNIGTWNIRTLYQTGALSNTIQQLEKYQMNITAIQEIRWTGTGTLNKNNFTIYYSGGTNNKHEFGCGFIINKKIQMGVIGFKPISNRICYIRIRMKFRNLSIFSIHAPTEQKSDEEKEEFYTMLDSEVGKAPENDIKLVLGDFNAQVGREDEYTSITGKYSLHHITNDNGAKLIQFAASNNLRIRSTAFPHKDIHKGTWISPDGRTINQIDHILVDSRSYSNILDVRSFRGAASESDHFLVKARFRERISIVKEEKGCKAVKYNTGKLKDEETAVRYRDKIKEHLETINRDNNDASHIENYWTEIKTAIKIAADEILGTYREKEKNEWYDDECKEAVNKRNEARIKLLQRHTRQKFEEYNRQRREAKYMCRKKKREYMDKQLEKIQEAHDKKEIRNFYRDLKKIDGNYQPRETMCRDNEGRILVNPEDVRQRWKTYFEELLSRKLDSPNRELENWMNAAQPVLEKPTIEEIKESINRMKNNKAPGIDEIPLETIKHGGEELIENLHQLIVIIWDTEIMPNEWRTAVICPVYKKGERLRCENYRGVSLLCVAYKIFTDLLRQRITPYVEENIGQYQGGFRRGKSTIDQLFIVRQIMEKSWEYDTGIFQLFIDFKQAYDTINREALCSAMLEMGIPTKLVNLTRMTMYNTKGRVKIQQRLTDEFIIEQGLRQGDGLAPILFNIALHKIIKEMKFDTKGTILTKEQQLVAYADDINIIGRSIRAVKGSYETLKEKAREMGLEINVSKTKGMAIRMRSPGQNWTIGDDNIEIVDEFTYLGSKLNNKNTFEQEIRHRITKGNRALYALHKTLKSKIIDKKTKVTVYKTLIRPVVTYGCETWTLTRRLEEMLDTFERKVLRKIYGPVRGEAGWRVRHNHELKQLYGDRTLVDHIKIQRLRWAGHVERMSEDQVPKKILKGQMFRNRSRGRPRTRWQDNIQRDAQELLGMRKWWEVARDRTRWRRKLREVMVQ